jgi:LmbE family N-acetylglucosaminyl deacetylase
MSTLLFFHAHPDDEAISTAGTMRLASRAGHRVVLVVATRGELGEGPHQEADLAGVRSAETRAAAEVLGVARVEFLGYRDSGMAGDVNNTDPRSFWQADVEEAATRLADIIEEESPAVLVAYDEHGGYGHPDHIQVHRVGHRAAHLTGVERVYEVTLNRDRLRELIAHARSAGRDEGDGTDVESLGMPDAVITTAVDVTGELVAKRAAMEAHASQIDQDSWFLSLPPDAFAAAFGTEWYIQVAPPFVGHPIGDREVGLLPE